jgi:hypothetical protein
MSVASAPTVNKLILSAPAAARAAITTRPAAAPPPGPTHVVPPKPGAPLRLSSRSLKVTFVVDGAALVDHVVPDGCSRVKILVNIENRKVTGELNPKSLRKAIATVREHGAERVAVVLQGALGPGDVLQEAGISAQVKAIKSTAGET